MTNEEIIESIKKKVGELFASYYKLVELKATEKFVILSSKALLVVLSVGIVALMCILLSIGLAIYLGELLENVALGYVSAASIYLILLIILIKLRKKLIYPLLRNFITKELYD